MLRPRRSRYVGTYHPTEGWRDPLPLACPVCSCERIDDQGRGVNCVCTRCGELFDRRSGVLAWRELMVGLTGDPQELELGDVLEFIEDPDARPFWIWDR